MARIIELPDDSVTSLVDIAERFPSNGWDLDKLVPKIRHIESLKAGFPGKHLPALKDTFNVFYYTPRERVRVVIIGQDPYFTPGVANGLAFSTRRGLQIPDSLKNIYTEVARTGVVTPSHGDLRRWATEEGVLLLNTCLTVTENQAGSHKKIWLSFMKPLLEQLVVDHPKLIWLIWGKKATEFKPVYRNCFVLETSHPSPMASRLGFIGCDHFNLVNAELTRRGERPIDWRID